MAGPVGDINANVGINISSGGLDKAISDLNTKVDKALSNIAKLGDASAGAGEKLTKKALRELGTLETQVKTLQRSLQGINAITNAQGRTTKNNLGNVFGTAIDDAKIAKSVRAVNEFKRSLDDSITPAEKLRARINAITKETADLAREGKTQTDARLRQQDQLSSSLKEYESLASRLNTSIGKVGALNPQSQKQLEAYVLKAHELQRVFNDLAGDGRRYNFGFLTDSMKSLTADIEKQVTGLAAQERLEAKLLRNTRERAEALLSISQRERQIELERRSSSTLNRLTPSQTAFGSAVGESGLQERLARATSAYTAAKRQLEAALAQGSNASEKEISRLITRMEFFDKKIVETIALQGRAARDNMTFHRQEEQAIDRIIAAQERLQRVQRGITFKEVTKGIQDSERALKEFEKQLNSLDSTGKEKISPLTKAFQGLLGDGGAGLLARVSIYALAAGAIYNVIGALKDGAKFAVEFEDKLATLQAISGSTKTQMTDLSASILEVGKNSKFSILDITDATIQLAQAGFTVSQTKDALQSVSDFAAASGTSVKESVDLITAALGAFQLQASETSRITDIFTAALNRSKLTSQQIAQALQYVGTTAYEQNVSLETLVATIGAVSQSGVRAGSTLGTGFRQFLVDLANPTNNLKEELDKLGLTLSDVDVKSRGLNAVLKTLEQAGFGAAQAYAGLEVRAAAFYLAAKNNLDVSQRLELAESERGVAAEATARAMDSLSAQTQRFYNILGKLASDSAPIEFFKELIKQAADSAERIGATSDELEELQKKQEEGFAPGFIQSLQTQAEYWLRVADEQENVEDKLRRLITTGSIYKSNAETQAQVTERLATNLNDASDATQQQANKIQELQGEYAKLLLQGPDLQKDSIQTSIVTNNLTSRFQGLADQLGLTANGYDNLVQAMKRYNAEQLRILGDKAAGEASAAQGKFAGLTRLGNTQLSAIRGQLAGNNLARFNGLFQNYQQGRNGALANLFDFANSIRTATPKAAAAIDGFTKTLSDRSSTRSQGLAALSLARDARFRSTDGYQALADGLAQIIPQVERGMRAGLGQTPAERSKALTPVLADVDKGITRLNSLIAQNQGKPVVLRNLQGLLGDYQSQRAQILGTIKPTDKETKQSERDARKGAAAAKAAERAAQRAQDTFNRNELSVSQSQLKSADKALQAFLGGSGQNFGLKDVGKLFEDGDKALNEWIAARRSVLADAITKSGLTDAQAKELTDAANDEIEAKQKATIQRQVEILDRAVQSRLERSTKRIENQYKLGLDDNTQRLGIQSGLSTGLNNPLLQGVPGYTRVIQQRQVELANDKLVRQQIGTRGSNGLFSGGENENRIREYNIQIDQLSEALEDLRVRQEAALAAGDQTKARAFAEEMERLGIIIGDQRDKVQDLYLANEQLRAQYSAGDLKPRSFGQAVGQAAEAFRIENDIGISLKERLFGGLDGALNDIHGSFQTFFTDIIAGTKGVGSAFGDMAKAVISALLEMAAKAVATQIFGLLLSFIPGAAPTTSFGSGGYSFAAGTRAWNGGPIDNRTPQRLIGGGPITKGLPTRDSVLVHAAQGEFMMKRSSVESIGHDLLMDMNNRGAAALSKLGGSNLVMPQSSFRSNVYVQLPEEKTQLGPNDVLAIVSRDVLRNGATKQLIKQVAAGG